jgi:hypothetical protein
VTICRIRAYKRLNHYRFSPLFGVANIVFNYTEICLQLIKFTIYLSVKAASMVNSDTMGVNGS